MNIPGSQFSSQFFDLMGVSRPYVFGQREKDGLRGRERRGCAVQMVDSACILTRAV